MLNIAKLSVIACSQRSFVFCSRKYEELYCLFSQFRVLMYLSLFSSQYWLLWFVHSWRTFDHQKRLLNQTRQCHHTSDSLPDRSACNSLFRSNTLKMREILEYVADLREVTFIYNRTGHLSPSNLFIFFCLSPYYSLPETKYCVRFSSWSSHLFISL